MREIVINTTKGEIKVISKQKSGFYKYRFGTVIHEGKILPLHLENNKFCGYCEISGDEALDYLRKNEIDLLSTDGNKISYIAEYLFKALN